MLAVEGGKALVITDKIIDFRSYHNTTSITWADCTIRAYLNGEFYNGFSATDRTKIADTHNVNKDNQWYGTSGGADTTDKIFLLSLEEVVKYFGDSGQLANGNPDDNSYYMIDDQYNNARIADNSGYSAAWYWWLRSPGDGSDDAAFVDYDGYVNVNGGIVDYSDNGLRPALWLNP
ncbi:MAG: DUF6273 domain-containing protein [Oscillospiraceae bacterium]|jgi:hypothetical protein|nr:DUF6273 domain-containing protein [Oscillospiraceae bacterium]